MKKYFCIFDIYSNLKSKNLSATLIGAIYEKESKIYNFNKKKTINCSNF